MSEQTPYNMVDGKKKLLPMAIEFVENPEPIKTITYRELRELAYMGAGVLHEDAIFPVRKAGIPINIKNTNRPEDRGTMIVAESDETSEYVITGIAGKKGFSVINIEKDMMNSEQGFGRNVLRALEKNGMNFEHMPFLHTPWGFWISLVVMLLAAAIPLLIFKLKRYI